MISLAQIGLIIIAIAWLIQLYFSFKGKREIRKEFIIAYMIGVLCLVIEDFKVGLNAMSYFEIGTFIAALLVLIKNFKK